MSLATLPPELYASIISHFLPDEVSQSVLSLTRALPYAPIPQHHLFHNIHIRHSRKLIQFYRRLRQSSEEENTSSLVQTFNLESWDVDAEVLLNVVHLLPNLNHLTLWIGPLNFAPQHLEELLDVSGVKNGARYLTCLAKLRSLTLRFKPYVQKATYRKFLEGSYFDGTLYAISRWPRGTLSTLSIIQDPFEEEKTMPGTSSITSSSSRRKELGFAQPIVFFQIEPGLPILLRSPAIRSSLTSFCFRIPSRNTIRSFTHPPPPNPPSFGPSRNDSDDSEDDSERIRRKYTHETAGLCATPCLKLLDISTSTIPASSVPTILGKYPSLEHLIMDGCGLLSGELGVANECGAWAALAKSLALSGAIRAQERQKKVEDWIERLREHERRELDAGGAEQAESSTSTFNSRIQAKKSRKGRKGVATATISLRKEDTPLQQSSFIEKAKFGGPRAPGGTTPIPISVTKRVRVLPSLPTLRSFTTDLSLPLSHPGASDASARSALLETIQMKWEEGWAEGMAQLVRRRQLMRTSWRNGIVRVVQFAQANELGFGKSIDDEEVFGDTEEGFDGLTDVQDVEDFEVDLSGQSTCGRAPILCLAGNDKAEKHLDGCGHAVQNVWGM
ncbi:hypothetical protein L218DRAFT_976492 [Marasmius fiardii PR-910]|nr:hypothetical protein L218DRAFT_976492 [Marasmius fiardii PR-910]